MQKTSNLNIENVPLRELYRHWTEGGEFRCHRLTLPDGTVGELIIKIPENKNIVTIEEVFVERGFRNIGLGTRLVDYAEDTAHALGSKTVELLPFSTDPVISDRELREWYSRRGYRSNGARMSKRIDSGKVTS